MTNGIISFLITVMTVVAAIMFAYAGYLLVTSGGDKAQYSKAKSLFTNVLIGFIIMLCAWLIIDTILKSLIQNSGTMGNTEFGPWNQIPSGQCARQAELDDGEANLFYDSWAALQDISLEIEERAQIRAANYGMCNEGFLNAYFPGQGSTASCVLQGESACGAIHESTTDIDRNGVPFSVSPWQINLTVHTIQDCDHLIGTGVTLDCPSAYNGRNYQSTIVDTALYEQCSRALTDPVCSTVNAQRIYREAGNSWSPWSAYTNNNCS